MPVVVMTLVALCGCRTPARHAALFEAAACNADKAACVERVLDAHGGRERALKFRYATYTLSGRRLPERLGTWLLGTPGLMLLNLFLVRPAQYYAATRFRTTHWHTRGDRKPRSEVVPERS